MNHGVTVTGWRKTTYSSGNGGACVEVGQADRAVAVRDTTDRDGTVLAFTPDAWKAFAEKVSKD